MGKSTRFISFPLSDLHTPSCGNAVASHGQIPERVIPGERHEHFLPFHTPARIAPRRGPAEFFSIDVCEPELPLRPVFATFLGENNADDRSDSIALLLVRIFTVRAAAWGQRVSDGSSPFPLCREPSL